VDAIAFVECEAAACPSSADGAFPYLMVESVAAVSFPEGEREVALEAARRACLTRLDRLVAFEQEVAGEPAGGSKVRTSRMEGYLVRC
jgi:hypothetical protein